MHLGRASGIPERVVLEGLSQPFLECHANRVFIGNDSLLGDRDPNDSKYVLAIGAVVSDTARA